MKKIHRTIKMMFIREMIGFDLMSFDELHNQAKKLVLDILRYEYNECNTKTVDRRDVDIRPGFVGYVHSEFMFSSN